MKIDPWPTVGGEDVASCLQTPAKLNYRAVSLRQHCFLVQLLPSVQYICSLYNATL